MTAIEQDLVERLSQVRALKGLPTHEIEWLVAHGRVESYPTGEVFRSHATPIPGLSIVMKGSLAIHVERLGVQRRVMQWHEGDLTGLLPYSRMNIPPGDTVVHEAVEVFVMDKETFPEMTRVCPGFTAVCVHTMLDRARHFTSTGFQDEKMISLGKLSAGLAHEMNNPASAAARGAKRLAEQASEAEDSAMALATAGLTQEQLAALDQSRAMCLLVPPSFLDTPLDQADRVDALAEWLEANGGDVDQASALAETAMTVEGLDKLASVMKGETLLEALRWLSATAAIRSVAHELQESTRRISELVQAVKGFTYMGRASVPEPVNVVRGLNDTARIMASKARDKKVALTLDAPHELPPARAFGSELNQIWINLIENALDAVPYGGTITVRARHEHDQIVVNVIDDGHGIPEDIKNRIFDPFFTTKPVGEGTGMGLDIVRRLVFQQGGEIEVQSEPGRTDFRVAIPLATTTPASVAAV